MPIVVVATIKVKPELVDAFREMLIGAVEDVHGEPGCELYALHQSGSTFVLVEQWADSEALRIHSAGPAATRLFAAAHEHLEGAPDIKTFTPLAVGDPEKGRLR